MAGKPESAGVRYHSEPERLPFSHSAALAARVQKARAPPEESGDGSRAGVSERSRFRMAIPSWGKTHRASAYRPRLDQSAAVFHLVGRYAVQETGLTAGFGVYYPQRLRHSQNKLERGMCIFVSSLLLQGVQPLLLGDAGSGRTEFMRWLHAGDAF